MRKFGEPDVDSPPNLALRNLITKLSLYERKYVLSSKRGQGGNKIEDSYRCRPSYSLFRGLVNVCMVSRFMYVHSTCISILTHMCTCRYCTVYTPWNLPPLPDESAYKHPAPDTDDKDDYILRYTYIYLLYSNYLYSY